MAETAVNVGQEAPDFTLRDENRQEVKLSDLRGQTVMLMFYPMAFSGVCEGEMCSIRDSWSAFEPTGVRVLAISGDNPFALKAWKEQQGFKHTFLSDMGGKVSREYGAWDEAAGVNDRLTVIIDKNGKVASVDRSPNRGTARDQQEALRAIQGMSS